MLIYLYRIMLWMVGQVGFLTMLLVLTSGLCWKYASLRQQPHLHQCLHKSTSTPGISVDYPRYLDVEQKHNMDAHLGTINELLRAKTEQDTNPNKEEIEQFRIAMQTVINSLRTHLDSMVVMPILREPAQQTADDECTLQSDLLPGTPSQSEYDSDTTDVHDSVFQPLYQMTNTWAVDGMENMNTEQYYATLNKRNADIRAQLRKNHKGGGAQQVDSYISSLNSRRNFQLKVRSGLKRDQRSRLQTIFQEVDVAVVGGGPAGSIISWMLQEREKCKVAIIDPNGNADATWYPNYGEWEEEWHALSTKLDFPELLACTTTEWRQTDSFFGGSYNKSPMSRVVFPRSYVRVDRVKLQKLVKDKYRLAGGQIIASKLSSVTVAPNIFDRNILHDGSGTTATLQDGSTVRCKVLIDATGFESRLVRKEDPNFARGDKHSIPVGYQIAYGMLCKVNQLGPYSLDTMTLFDYRTDHLDHDVEWRKDAESKPTFNYVMPLSKNDDGTYTVFFEETSLVGKDCRRLTFQECKKRLYKRLSYHNIEVLNVKEEEYCYIPMGGELPDLKQRVIAFGAAASMVHPSTGYQACRMMAAAPAFAAAVGEGIRAGDAPDLIAARAYGTLWNKQNRGQRDFQVFGGDFFMEQPVHILWGFFSAFFALDTPTWAGFLAGWPGLPHNELHETWSARLWFALTMFVRMPNDVRIAIIGHAIKYTVQYGPKNLLRSLLPEGVFGSYPPEPAWLAPAAEVGVPVAKGEARSMMRQFDSWKSIEQVSDAEIEHTAVDAVDSVVADTRALVSMFPAPFN